MTFFDAFDQPLSGHLVLVLDREAAAALKASVLRDPDPGVPNAVSDALGRYLADGTRAERCVVCGANEAAFDLKSGYHCYRCATT